MGAYDAHKEDYTRFLRELTVSVFNSPNAALCDSLLSLELLGKLLAKHGCVRLYKYQPFDERNVRDFLDGAMHMSPVDSFNDVNEGWQRFDEATVLDEIDKAPNIDIEEKLENGWDGLAEAMRKAMPNAMPPSKERAVELWKKTVEAIESSSSPANSLLWASRMGLAAIRESARCASLSETVSSASMWDRYADGNKGFALGYDFSVFNLACGLGRECSEGPEATGLLAPVIYGERSDLSMLFMACCLYQELRNPINNLFFLTMANMFARKAAEWRYEREWRVLTLALPADARHMYVRKKPDAIYLGLKMGPDEKRRLKEAAVEAELDVYSMEMDYESEDYSLKPVRVA